MAGMRIRVAGVALAVIGTAALLLPARAAAEDAAGVDDAAMMEAWTKAMTPGEQHQRLAWFVGKWEYENTSFWGDEPTTETGTSEMSMDLGGRYLVSTHTSQVMGQPFEGHGIDGYDNTTGKCFSIWRDNMSTGYMLLEGTPSEDGKTQVVSGSYVDPVMGPMTTRFVTTITGDDTFTMTMYMTPEGQPEMKSMEMKYRRVGT